MHKRFAVGALLLLLVPAVATAAVIQFDSDADDGDGSFNAAGASGSDGLRAPAGVFVDGSPLYLEVCDQLNCDDLSLSLTWVVGPLLGFVPGDPGAPGYVPGVGTYSYGPGTLTVDGRWQSHNEPGIFIAEIRSLVIDLTDEGLYGIDGTVRATLGPGVFQPALARLLGVSTHTVGGSYGIDTDGAFFDRNGNGYGLGDNYGPGLAVDAVAIPEPASALLAGFGLLCVTARRRLAAHGARRSPDPRRLP